MKKRIGLIISILIIFIVSICLTGCGGNKEKEEVYKEEQDNKEEIYNKVEVSEKKQYVVASENDFTLEEKNGEMIISSYTGNDSYIIIPTEIQGIPVTIIDSETFEDSSIKGVIISDSVVKIEERAFSFAVDLQEVKLGKNVKELGEETFSWCENLENVTFNEGLEVIGEAAFAYDGKLSKIDFPSTVKTIEINAFALTDLREVNIPSTVKTIGKYAFSYCENLKTITIEEGVTTMGSGIAYNCEKLEKINIPKSVVNHDGSPVINCPTAKIHIIKDSEIYKYYKENYANYPNLVIE